MPGKRIDSHTIKILEFEQVIRILQSYAASDLGREAAGGLYPSVDAEWIKARLAETTELRKLLELGYRLPLAGLYDIRQIVTHIGEKQTVLEPEELIRISDTIAVSGKLKNFFLQIQDVEDVDTLMLSVHTLADFEDIVREINRCIENEKTIRDNASEKLQEIRKSIGHLASQIQKRFREIVANPEIRRAVANENFLTRHGRAVVLVKTNYRHYIPGMILDRSNTGETLYIEPYELASLSNELEDTLFAEKKEVERILRDLTRLVLEHRHDILKTIKVLSHIDLTCAKARYSIAFNMSAPEVQPDGFLLIRSARHPLLLQWAASKGEKTVRDVLDEVVPVDVRLGKDFDMLLVTGPNTGGKTVTLKTIGLINLMAQAGMHIPAWPDSQIPVYRQIFADIGDEQSIQQSLSTFSAHITQIVRIMEKTNDKTLVLLDELGAGTDPNEGAALGTAILDNLLAHKCHTAITTHLGTLKNYAYTTDRVENASVRFDVNTMKPTYELIIGTPGSSNALIIARRLGMGAKLITRAKTLLDHQSDNTSNLINKVQATRQKAEHDRKQAQTLLDEVKGMQILASERLERASEEGKKLRDQADKMIDQSIRQVRTLTDNFIHEMHNAPHPWLQKAEQFRDAIHQAADATPLAQRQQQFLETVRSGDTVYILTFHREAIVQRIRRKRRIMVLLMDGKQIEVPFSEIWQPLQN
ncbi:MAG: hypothetical protein JW860_02670 [Sedimentisphaerales bacterium]|nr:hypothetical protein [Sedimentisphaerales bacterium]